jgi:ribosomal subunit interface protein
MLALGEFKTAQRSYMQTPLQITFREIQPSDALDARIREKAEKLEAFYPGIISCRVVVEERDRHRNQGKEFCVRLDIRIPQHEIAVNRDHNEDVYVALRDAFNAATRKIEELGRVQRGKVKAHTRGPRRES